MITKKYLSLISKIIIVFLTLVLCIWFIPNYTKGIDVTDTCFSLIKYKYSFNQQLSLTTFSTIFTDILGGIIYHAASSHQLLIMNLANAAFYTISSLFIIALFKKELPVNLLLFIALICNFFSLSNMHIFNYNTTSLFALTFAFGTLLCSLRRNDDKLLFVSGFICGINVFFRLPNILHTSMALGILWYTIFCKKMPVKTGFRKFFKYISGILLSILLGVILSVLYLGSSSISATITQTFDSFTDHSSGNSHSALSIFAKLKYHYSVVFDNWIMILIILFFITLSIYLLSKYVLKLQSNNTIIRMLCICLGLFLSIFSFYKTKKLYNLDFKLYAFWMIIIVLSLIVSLWGAFYYHNKNSFISTACFLNSLLIVILPIGTDVGCLYYNYFLFIPTCIFSISLSHIQIKLDNQKKKHFIYYFLCTYLLCYTCISGFFYQNSYIYRDDTYSNLTTKLNIPELAGMHTTKERADMITLTTSLLAPYSDYEIATLGDFNVLPVITDMKCFFSTPWPDLSSFPPAEFITEADEKINKGILPVIVLTPQLSIVSDKNSPYRSTEKYKKLLDIISKNNYQTLYKSDNLEIYIPLKENEL